MGRRDDRSTETSLESFAEYSAPEFREHLLTDVCR
jgi:hypothetical protein